LKYSKFVLLIIFAIFLDSCGDPFFYDITGAEVSLNISVGEPGRGFFRINGGSSLSDGGEFKIPKDSRVTLEAVPADGNAFVSWRGAQKSYDPVYSFTLRKNTDVTLNFLPQGENPWLIMIYMAAANSLESDGLKDLNDMEYGLSQADDELLARIKVLVLFDRISAADLAKADPQNSSYYDTAADGDWAGTRLYEVLPDADRRKINSRIIETAGSWRGNADQEESMGNKETLSSFLGWAGEAYPEYNRHALILWNHGGGVSVVRSVASSPVTAGADSRSICLDDEDYDNGYGLNGQLFLGEISEVLSRHYNSSRKLEFIGFDACYMGMYEIAYQFKDYARYFAAAPGVEYSGWAYRDFLHKNTAFTDGESLAREIVLSFAENADRLDHSLTAYNLEKIGPLKTTVDRLASVIAEEIAVNPGFQKILEMRRDTSLHYYKSESESLQYPFYDLGSLCKSLADTGSVSVNFNAQQVLAALGQGVVYAWKNFTPSYSGSGIEWGLTIFFSRGNLNFNSGSKTYSHYANHWYYTHLDTNDADTGYAEGFYYGQIDAADSDTNGIVETWRELLEYLYDPYDPGAGKLSSLTPGRY
jgi:hypothetical protein